jgi:phosphate transport system permease protein
VFREGAPILGNATFSLWQFLTSAEWFPTSMSNVRFGTLALLAGTLSVTGVAMLIAVPFGMGAAIFVSEFSSGKVREILKVIIELLAAIPSIVWGFIGLTVMNPLIQKLFGVPVGLNVLNAAILLALMSIPVIVSIGEDALKAVPDSYREGALALGATRWQIVWRVLLPAAKNGLLAAVLLGVGRAVGETMAVLMATGHAVQVPHSIFDSCRTLTATIAAELGEASDGSPHYRVLFLIGILLFTITFIVNLVADLVVKGIKGK